MSGLNTVSMRGLLSGMAPNDSSKFAGVAPMMAAIGIVACWIPALARNRAQGQLTGRSTKPFARRYAVRRRLPNESDSEVLSNPVAERVLTRASELDAALRGGTMAVSELRSAAVEAGISSEAFDAALAEVRDAEEAPVPNVMTQPSAHRWRWLLGIAAVLVTVGTLGVARVTPDAAGPPMVEKTFLLRCLPADQAARLVRPVLDLPTNTVIASADGVLIVHATSAQIEKVQSVLDPYEGAGAPACVRTPPATTGVR